MDKTLELQRPPRNTAELLCHLYRDHVGGMFGLPRAIQAKTPVAQTIIDDFEEMFAKTEAEEAEKMKREWFGDGEQDPRL